MSENPFHPYTLEVQPGARPGTLQWVIRRNGQLVQRSDKTFNSEQHAQKDGTKARERLLVDGRGAER